MDHVDEEELYAHIFQDRSLDERSANHLQHCKQCQQHVSALRRLAQEFLIARRSQPSPAQMARYVQLIQQVQQQSSVWTRLAQHVQMALALDSRQQSARQGLRSGMARAYRLLYSADAADVELLVEPEGYTRRIQGEVLPLDADALLAPVLVELLSAEHKTGIAHWTVESNAQGRFQLDGITVGYYHLTITPTKGPYLQIKGIDIT